MRASKSKQSALTWLVPAAAADIWLAISAGFAGLLILNGNLFNINRLRIQAPMFVLMTVSSYLLVRCLPVRALARRTNWPWQKVVIVVLTLYSLYVAAIHYWAYLYLYFPSAVHFGILMAVKTIGLGALGFYATFIAWQLFFEAVRLLYHKLALTGLEKRTVVIYATICTLLIIIFSLFVTDTFVLKLNIVDTIYSQDSSALLYDEIYDNNAYGLNTDIRHPLAQAANTPLGIVSRVVGSLIRFVPYAQEDIFQIFLVLMIALIGILLVRLMELRTRLLQIAVFVLYAGLYSTLIFTFAVEQYVPAVLFTILFIYGFKNRWSFRWSTGFLIMAAGYVFTSAVLVLLWLTETRQTLKERLKKLVVAAAAFLLVTISLGKLLTLVFADRELAGLAKFGKDVTLHDKLYQFVNFIASTITAGYHTVFFDGTFYKYRAADVDMIKLNIAGLVIFFLALAGAWIGRKRFLARVAAGWVVFSFVICVIVGWGAKFNEMPLYGLYFGWAYMVLAFMVVQWLAQKLIRSGKWREIGLAAVCVAVVVMNLIQFSDILRFAHKHYPPIPLQTLIQQSVPYNADPTTSSITSN